MNNMPSGSRRKLQTSTSEDAAEDAILEKSGDPNTESRFGKSGRRVSEDSTERKTRNTNSFDADGDSAEEISDNQEEETETYQTHRYSDDEFDSTIRDQGRSSRRKGSRGCYGDESNSDERGAANQMNKLQENGSRVIGESNGINGTGGEGDLSIDINKNDIDNQMSKLTIQETSNTPKIAKDGKRSLSTSSVISGLMDTYLNSDYAAPGPKPKPRRFSSVDEKQEQLEKNLRNLKAKPSKKQPPPPVRSKPQLGSKDWSDPKTKQRPKSADTQWPPKNPPLDGAAYVVESYGQTDPYSKRLIKDIQKSKREEEEKKAAEKRAEVVPDSIQPVSTLRSTFTTKPAKVRPGVQRPEANIAEEKSWIKHEKKVMNYDAPPDEPDWMKLIRNRRWKSTVKARFPCKEADKTEFERRSTTPKNWKRLAQDKNAMRMLSEVVGIGPEGEELFMRLASQREKLEEEKEKLDQLTEEELMAYEVARESLGEDAAYSLQMDNPLPAARMKHLGPNASIIDGSDSASGITNASSASSYPFTTSQLEAAYLTNQLLKLHPEEFKKLMSLERSRQATLRWQFSADPFDSVHEHQSLPYEIAMLASQEPRVQQAMRKILAQGSVDEYSPVYSSASSRYARSEGYARSESDQEGYESSTSTTPAVGLARGRTRRKKAPLPPPKNFRGRSVSPSMMRNDPSGRRPLTGQQFATLPAKLPNVPSINHSLFDDDDLVIGDEVAKLDQLTSNISRDIDEDLAQIESSIEDRKRGFFEEAIRNENVEKATNAFESVDSGEIASRRKNFIDKDRETSSQPDPRENIPKQRHKVRRISSNAELSAVFRKRRQASESEDEAEHEDRQEPEKGSAELTNLVSNITNTFG